jgi:hypothetical protein
MASGFLFRLAAAVVAAEAEAATEFPDRLVHPDQRDQLVRKV